MSIVDVDCRPFLSSLACDIPEQPDQSERNPKDYGDQCQLGEMPDRVCQGQSPNMRQSQNHKASGQRDEMEDR